ncbi:hypothetical protein T439DRAFT_321165 [Meredithblackwellia eburnea MCA 4105]
MTDEHKSRSRWSIGAALPSILPTNFPFVSVFSTTTNIQSQAQSPTTTNTRRFPLPPTRGSSISRSQSPEDSMSRKRDRQGWLPHSTSNNNHDDSPSHSTSTATGAQARTRSLSPSTVRVSNTRAEGSFDTPRSYLPQASSSSSPSSSSTFSYSAYQHPDQADRPSTAHDAAVPDQEDLDAPPAKRRKGLAGSVLSGALDAAIFTTALTYSAYQLWKHPPSSASNNADVDKILEARTRTPTQQSNGSSDAPPPPYAEQNPHHLPPTRPNPPSQIPRRVRHFHQLDSSTSRGSNTRRPVLSSSARSNERRLVSGSTTADSSFALTNHLRYPIPEFQPYSPRSSNEDGIDEADEDDDDEDGAGVDDDPQMAAVAKRLQDLIESGREALLTPPPSLPSAAELPSPLSSGGGGTLGSSVECENDGREMDGEPKLVERDFTAGPPSSRAGARKSGGMYHIRRQSASAAFNSPLPVPRAGGAGGGRSSFGGFESVGGPALGASLNGHRAKSSRGGSLGGYGDLRMREMELERERVREESGTERKERQVLGQVLERAGRNSTKGWWET